MRRASVYRPSKARSSAGSYNTVGEGQLLFAPAAREAPRAAVVAGVVPVPLTSQEEDQLPASAARESQTPAYLYLRGLHENVPLWLIRSGLPSLNGRWVSSQAGAG